MAGNPSGTRFNIGGAYGGAAGVKLRIGLMEDEMGRKSYEDDLRDESILSAIARRVGQYMNRNCGKIHIYGVKRSYDNGRHAYLVAKCLGCGTHFCFSETAIGRAMAGGCFYCRSKAQPIKTEGLENED